MSRVVVVDDSPVARRLIVHILQQQPDIVVVGEAVNGREALERVRALRPDVVTMDIRMPVMDGYEATARIMETTPTPIIMVSAHEPAEMRRSFRAVEAGALTVLRKPLGDARDAAVVAADLVASVRAMTGLQVVTRRRRDARHPRGFPPADPAGGVAPSRHRARTAVVGIAASTGGPAALATVLRGLAETTIPVPILVVQHIAEGFDEGLVGWLDGLTPLMVRLAADGMIAAPGEVAVAPNGRHLTVLPGGRIRLTDDDHVDGHRPSATPFFASLAAAYGDRAVGVILTGIGRDGCDGLSELHRAGGRVIAQDEASSIVWGMPRAAIEAGHADSVLAIDEIAPALIAACRGGASRA